MFKITIKLRVIIVHAKISLPALKLIEIKDKITESVRIVLY